MRWAGRGTEPDAVDRFYAVIPAGGIGSRLWPLSRADAPKFLHDLTGSGKTLLRETWDRLAPIAGEDRIMVVTGRAHRAAVEAQLPEPADRNVVLESEPKDSSAAIGLAAAILERREPDVIIGSFAADHVIGDLRRFRQAVVEAVAVGGRRATSPRSASRPPSRRSASATSSCGDRPRDRRGADRAARSTGSSRSPTSTTARGYVDDRRLPLERRHVHRPRRRAAERDGEDEARPLRGLRSSRRPGTPRDRGAVVDRVWPGLEKIAIDYTVAEPAAAAGRLAVIPGDFDWDDVGDFASIAKLHSGGRGSPTSRSSARTPACSPTPRAASSSARQRPAHLADRRREHRRRRHPGRPARHHQRARPAGEERGRRAEALRPHRRALSRSSARLPSRSP